VKLRGYRIELGEIESVMMQHPVVDQATVVVKKQDNNELLVGYYTADHQIESQEFKNYLLKKLPDFMVPAVFELIDHIPLTPNGKVNRKALENRKVNIVSSVEYIAPRNETEQQIADIWQELLHLDQIGVNDNFFELGGHSLLATRVISKLNKTFQTNLSVIHSKYCCSAFTCSRGSRRK